MKYKPGNRYRLSPQQFENLVEGLPILAVYGLIARSRGSIEAPQVVMHVNKRRLGTLTVTWSLHKITAGFSKLKFVIYGIELT